MFRCWYFLIFVTQMEVALEHVEYNSFWGGFTDVLEDCKVLNKLNENETMFLKICEAATDIIIQI